MRESARSPPRCNVLGHGIKEPTANPLENLESDEMKPYYDQDGITIYLGDNRQIVPQLDGPFDLLLTDPPYGLGSKLHDGGTWSTNPIYDAMLEWDTLPAPQWMIQQCIDRTASAIIWGGNYYQFPPSRCWLSWHKVNSVPTMADMELAWTNLDANSKQFDEIINSDGKRSHPTQKPLSLMGWCLSKVPDAKTVLDPWMGSGTTLVAAKLRGLKAVAIEINEGYCEIAVRRLAQGVLITA